jgi:hypothetical protein
MGRPQFFTIDPSHQLARGLVFAGLGHAPGGAVYRDSSPRRNSGAFNTGAFSTPDAWLYDSEIQRTVNRFSYSLQATTGVTLDQLGGGDRSFAIWIRCWDSSLGFPFGNRDTAVESAGCGIIVPTSRKFRTEIGGSQVTTDDSLRLLEWDHVAVVCRYNDMPVIYLNGRLAASTNNSTNYTDATKWPNGSFYYGTCGMGSTAHATLADLMVWNRVITEAEIHAVSRKNDPWLNGFVRPLGQVGSVYDLAGVR